MHQTLSRYTLAIVLGVGLGCGKDRGDDGDGGPATQIEVEDACQAYCQRAKLCDDETVIAECETKCEKRMGNCMADEQGQAVDDLNICADESCDDFRLCTVGTGLQCAFGL